MSKRFSIYYSPNTFLFNFNLSEKETNNSPQNEPITPNTEPVQPSVDFTNEVQKGDEPRNSHDGENNS